MKSFKTLTIMVLVLACAWHTACGDEADDPTYIITIDPAPAGGSITLDPADGPYDEGTVVTVTAEAQEGYAFDAWRGDLSGTTNPETLTMDEDKTISAAFREEVPETYTITIDPAPAGGSITLDPAVGPYEAGTEVTVTAAADAGYTFDEWDGDLSGIEEWGTHDGTEVENNIIISEGGLGTGYAIGLDAALSISNNNLFGYTYYCAIGGDVADMDATAVTTGDGTGTLESFGNVSIDMIDNGGNDYFTDPDGADDDLATTEDNDWHLASDAAILNVREGGLDQSEVDEFPVNGSSEPIDIEGTVRTAGDTDATNANAAGWSMGAYEAD
ncbi:MAG: InlB B-repeat-containing protein [Pseudomonadota bacterium]